MKIKVVNKTEFELPKYETIGSAGMDLRANLKSPKPENISEIDPYNEENWDEPDTVILEPRKQQIVPTGIFIQLPKTVIEIHSGEGYGYEAQIRPRSGLAAKYGITVVNSPGTIDSDYRGEIKVILMNLTDEPFTINHGDRIAQMVITRHEKVSLYEAGTLDETERGTGGFMSTGLK